MAICLVQPIHDRSTNRGCRCNCNEILHNSRTECCRLYRLRGNCQKYGTVRLMCTPYAYLVSQIVLTTKTLVPPLRCVRTKAYAMLTREQMHLQLKCHPSWGWSLKLFRLPRNYALYRMLFIRRLQAGQLSSRRNG